MVVVVSSGGFRAFHVVAAPLDSILSLPLHSTFVIETMDLCWFCKEHENHHWRLLWSENRTKIFGLMALNIWYSYGLHV